MTNIILIDREDTYEVKAEGHATGSSEVCAAISVLITTFKNLTVKETTEEKFETADVHFTVNKKPKTQRFIEFLEEGLMSLEEAYGQFIHVKLIRSRI